MWYDLLVLGILIFFAVRGASRGVVFQIAGIAGLVLCFAFAESLSAAFGPHVSLEPPLNNWVVMFGAYLVFSFVAFGFARVLDEWIQKANLEHFNRHLGAVFGLLKGIAICLVLTFFVVTLSPASREALKNSKSGRAAAIVMDRLHPVMPEKLHDALAKYIHQLDSDELDLIHRHDHSHDHGDDSTQPDHVDLLGGAIQLGESVGWPDDATDPFAPAEQAPAEQAPADGKDSPRTAFDEMLVEISRAYSSIPAVQGQVQEDVRRRLADLPTEVSLAVLKDWRRDLYSPGADDPDPTTNANSTLESRIVRQLQARGMPTSRLSSEQQDGLDGAALK